MSYILFCKGHTAKNPFVIANLRKKIYTIEELCYYLYRNPSLCQEELLRLQLADWIGSQLGFLDLSDSIKTMILKNPAPEKVASQIFAYVDYLSKAERDAVCERIRKYSLLSIHERKKMRADYYVVEGNYKDAIIDYEEMLTNQHYQTAREQHHIIYNIGCCYGSMFYFDLAYDWFIKAASMEISQEDDYKAALFCKKMTLSDEKYRAFVSEHEEFEAIASQLNGEVAACKNDFLKLPSTKELIGYQEGKRGRGEEYQEFIKKKVDAYKAES